MAQSVPTHAKILRTARTVYSFNLIIMSRIVALAGVACLVAGFVPQGPAPRGTPIESFQGYRSWYCDTPEAKDMATAVAASCIGPPSWDMNPVNPHVPRLFKIYVNPTGKAAFISLNRDAFPIGSMIVKEKYVAPTRKDTDWFIRKLPKGARPELLTVMIKREKGFDPANGDWEYQVASGDAQKSNAKGLEHCAKCHQDLADQDYVFERHCGFSREAYIRGYNDRFRKKSGGL